MSAEEALEAAILAVLAENEAVAELRGDPLRVTGMSGPSPAFPYIEVARHESADAGSAGVEASEHRVDLAVMCRDAGGLKVKAIVAAIRGALTGAELVMTGWRCVLLVPLFSDAARSSAQTWRGLLRLKAIVKAAD